MDGEPVFIDSTRLNIICLDYPPSDVGGYHSDGIEYYCCCNKNCDTAWAVQWAPQPRRKLVYGSVSLHTYKTFAVSKLCAPCEKTIREADEDRKKQYGKYKAKQDQEALIKGRGKEDDENLIKLMDNEVDPEARDQGGFTKQDDDSLIDHGLVEAYRKSRGLQTVPMVLLPQDPQACALCWGVCCCCTSTSPKRAMVANDQAARQARTASASNNANQRVHQGEETECVAEKMTTHLRSLQPDLAVADPLDAFDEVSLSPRPQLIEDPEMLAARDPSWDVVVEEDATEDWAIINHFGSIAIEHRDAHVDTPTVRP
ncbi:hypothetical protein G647_03353 [Cladophialophora carrionii CBS 160.54]|uniref:Uncharacterized protein n=1 Tax=Cladophialophora carrionii CBS 160.54 TaxID=1279043 RepID=V9DI78_9EURO|nr:uncharacterized protein G647_03353 [Cladophialophora carrionii CBS 160.54]ETI26575.1 hypothetical protein G647_03353 [Cladophialophora carrionii CBS 160.54]